MAAFLSHADGFGGQSPAQGCRIHAHAARQVDQSGGFARHEEIALTEPDALLAGEIHTAAVTLFLDDVHILEVVKFFDMLKERVHVLVNILIVAGSHHPVILAIVESFIINPGEHLVVLVDIPELVEFVGLEIAIGAEIVIEGRAGGLILESAVFFELAVDDGTHPGGIDNLFGLDRFRAGLALEMDEDSIPALFEILETGSVPEFSTVILGKPAEPFI